MSSSELARWERAVVGVGLAATGGLAWLYLFRMARQMASDAEMAAMPMSMPMPMTHPMSAAWSGEDFLMTFLMWAVMMVAMMVPSAAPMILTFATVNRNRRTAAGNVFVPTWIFLAGYLTIWTAFSLLATLLQWALHSASLLAPMTLTVGPAIGGSLFIVAGLYQWTPIKDACLTRCAAPLDFLLGCWREGKGGALVMGLHHGLYCVGCCAFLMTLLLVLGVMNLLWVAALGGLVLVEKLAKTSRFATRAFGVAFVVAGIALFASSL